MSLQQVKEFASLIEKFNKKINLVSRKDIANLWSRHIEDGLRSHNEYLNNYRLPDEYSFYDLGSGNGIPGMIWAILSPSNLFFLVDTDERKCEFLKYASTKLELNNVVILNQDFAAITPPLPYVFLSRGLMSIQEFLSSESKFNESPGFFIKGSTWNNEIGHIPAHYFAYSDYSLDGDTQRSLVYYKGKSEK
ncbi:MAG: class I SAM-dependent methyltransferase [Bdellovibrionaceae bacterium]|nr:class I SAM-dependent methyltransferase [Pseudobdellovibrionaceae bacterium]